MQLTCLRAVLSQLRHLFFQCKQKASACFFWYLPAFSLCFAAPDEEDLWNDGLFTSFPRNPCYTVKGSMLTCLINTTFTWNKCYVISFGHWPACKEQWTENRRFCHFRSSLSGNLGIWIYNLGYCVCFKKTVTEAATLSAACLATGVRM